MRTLHGSCGQKERSARAKFWAAMQTEGSEFRFGAQALWEPAHTSPGFKLGCGTPHTRSRLKSANMLLAPASSKERMPRSPLFQGCVGDCGGIYQRAPAE